MTTHLGQKPKDHVVLEIVGTAEGLDFQRNLPDGTSSGIFRVPRGMVLVVTDVDWQYNAGTPGERQTLRLSIVNLADPTESRRVFESSVMLNNSGSGGISEAMTSGFVVSSAARLAVDEEPGGGVLNHAILRGYLSPE